MRKRVDPGDEFVFVEEKRGEWENRTRERTEAPPKRLIPVKRIIRMPFG